MVLDLGASASTSTLALSPMHVKAFKNASGFWGVGCGGRIC